MTSADKPIYNPRPDKFDPDRLVGGPISIEEHIAFQAVATGQKLPTSQHHDGLYLNEGTTRAHGLWRSAVFWTVERMKALGYARASQPVAAAPVQAATPQPWESRVPKDGHLGHVTAALKAEAAEWRALAQQAEAAPAPIYQTMEGEHGEFWQDTDKAGYDAANAEFINTRIVYAAPVSQDAAIVADHSGVQEPVQGDAIAKSKHVLELVDQYIEDQTAANRTLLRGALMAELDTRLTPHHLLDIARETGLRQHLHGVNATDARVLLAAFVGALPAATIKGAHPTAVGGAEELRASFEAWAFRSGWEPKIIAIRDGDGYSEPYLTDYWGCWKDCAAAITSRPAAAAHPANTGEASCSMEEWDAGKIAKLPPKCSRCVFGPCTRVAAPSPVGGSTDLTGELYLDVMNIPCDESKASAEYTDHRSAYKHGHRDARHAAADIVNEFSSRPAALAAPDDIRARGWAVAVHNDYRLNGVANTFWLFTKDGCAVKGEGKTDAEALNEVRAALAAAQPQQGGAA